MHVERKSQHPRVNDGAITSHATPSSVSSRSRSNPRLPRLVTDRQPLGARLGGQLDRQLDQLDRDLELIARGERWASMVQILTQFKEISTRIALGWIAEIGDFRRFSHPREMCAWLGIVPSEYSSGEQRYRGHITRTGNHYTLRLLVEAAQSHQQPTPPP